MEGNWRPDPQLLNSCTLPFIELFKFVSSSQYVVFGIAVCSAPPSPPMNGSVQVDDGKTYLEGDEVNFQCLSGLRPADVMTTTNMEGSWYPDPQLLNCRSPGMYGIVQVSFIFLIFHKAVCSGPPSPLNGSVQADDGRTYVEGDEVNFQCLSGTEPFRGEVGAQHTAIRNIGKMKLT